MSEAQAQRSAVWVLAAAILGSGMAFLDTSVVNVALPALQAALGGSGAALQWVMNAYTLTLGALILVGGAAGDRYGRRQVFLAGIVVFAIGSVLCGAAPGAAWLIAARALQGVGGAMMVPQSLALIAAAFPAEARARAIGTWAGAAALTTALGPAFGGWLVEALSWRAVFLVNIPVATATVLIAARHVPESRDPKAGALDWAGAALMTAGLALLTVAATGGVAHAKLLLAGAVATLAILAWHEARAPHAMLPKILLRSRAFIGANVATLLLYGALGFSLFVFPFAMIRLRGLSPAEAGASFLPMSGLLAVLSRPAGSLVRRTGPRPPLVAGALVAGVGFLWLARAADPSVSYLFAVPPAMILLGLGMAVAIPPLTDAALSAAPDALAGTASGVNNAVARLASLLAVATLASLVLFDQQIRYAHSGQPGSASRGFAQADNDDAAAGVDRQADAAARHAFAGAVADAQILCGGLAIAAAVVAAATLRGRRTAPR